ncbi:TPA: ABC transporter ATP-binding protein [Yersinia enterocolitica]|uniref:ABC transporter ATP-binding protein n=1 Tax=Yersinia enterocolitica TaxID=630 RepID=A0A7T9XSD7_YEREN|nr:ABC transporter ATP-binding protein [Yersinia enterocolitica]QQU46219.1 ABC transporter ATP-binding protein [Yersinia enterocolitica]CFW59832.1 putative ABC transport ATP-binding subunit [Yersinia enterocolitica]CND00248.1 putative ABC transport ATP-binding subunit [Yersinia enterocolitica]CNF84576.1 putative ABC transport ATP-binding subunit [Yersinia enterocolitica]CNH39177.1 putative ABC transport ATP-binding subunit [Yersinia enterocolitica]
MIHFHQVSKYFAGKRAVDNLTLQISKGEFTVLIGTSGSGKSTTLKMINRLIEHDEGEIHFAGEEIRNYKPEDIRRRMGYAIQSIGLFPHWTVEHNIGTVPQLLKWPQERIRLRVIELLELLHLDPEQFLHRYPHQLSGGQQQRVGVARALAADPEVLLMDEPFGALDPVTRSALQFEITRIHQLSGRTIVLVTHDIDEALADRIVLMDGGRVIQQGTPLEMLTQPVNDFVRDFFGRSDLGIKLLSLGRAEQRIRRGETMIGQPILGTTSLREALSLFVSRQTDKLLVVDEQGQPLGVLYFADLIADADRGEV